MFQRERETRHETYSDDGSDLVGDLVEADKATSDGGERNLCEEDGCGASDASYSDTTVTIKRSGVSS